nr:MAG TPA: hypothetical protein [Caudoviricetes sp.]
MKRTEWIRSKDSPDRRQITLRMPETVYRALKEQAEKQGIAVNDLILLKISPLQVNFRDSHFSSDTVSK